MKKQYGGSKLGLTIGVLVLAAVAVWGYLKWTAPDTRQQVNTARAEVRDVEVLVTATGRLQPRDFVDVGAQVSGQLERLLVEVGDQVEQGQLLAEIDPTLLESQVESNQAQLRNQQAVLREREAQYELSRLNYQRQERLQGASLTSEELVETARATMQQAQAQVDSIRAQIDQTQSSLRAAEANLNYTRIFAPMSGTVVSIEARRGQTLNAAQTTPTILTIADLSEMTVEAQVSEADIGRLELGMPVYFTTMGNRTQRWHGELRLIEPTPVVENNVVLYNALFEVPNDEGRLMTQMTTNVFFIADAARDAVTVPAAAVRRDREGAYVEVISSDGSQRQVRVSTGVSDRVHTAIESGIDAGAQVVIPAANAAPMAAGGGRGMRG
ncbi:efflux RND transporter periplasmic adaptor subunit [Aliidiomarina maris]|uniref:Efflux RND transporter periplasmic adaptor subunit n=1 Tax=Aliidiomarina maris TaxID=531312 RepID=A0A327WZS2_9GAMM|nr:efflux RND transporter periplasmic adaptor subunit [Aliidiomarina maris]MCL5051273.1 efflux RND transporter periplasmic adaptor subunit [Bacillota bacterium]RAJ99230.1 macrolide-specific efflux system membrane fusion protein [Aliidiomarina maris]RUO27626.1 efflux RND transporter periplasmic adaptor subunit [Aliidiomarina maris]